MISDNHTWTSLLPQQKLEADKEHYFETEIIKTDQPITHIKLKIYPDGGVSRLRILGTIK